MPSAPEIDRLLRDAALRVTRPRVAVLAAVRDNPHSDTDSIIRLVRDDMGDVSHQAVYDVLAALTAAGLLRRFQPMGSVARYETRTGDNHHHVVCRSCGAIADVDCAVGHVPCLTASDDSGYEIGEAEVIYWGRCPDCIAEDRSGPEAIHSDVRQPAPTAAEEEQSRSRATGSEQPARQEKHRRD